MTTADSTLPTALSTPLMHSAPSAGQRLARTALSLAALSTLGGCALWTAMFSENPPEVPVPTPPTVAAPQPAASAPVAAAPTPAASEPAPAPVVSTPVNAPPPPTAAELIPPSPLPVAPAPAPASPQRPSAAVVPTAAGFYLNIGLFAVPTNGSNAVHKLEAAGQPVFFEVIDSKKGPLTRVRVGPFAKRSDADAAAKKIHALKLDAVVFQRK
ncbi:MAG: SPOR domain-containing protein [Rhodoferax sp.]|nr:MAG: SPOR domain-containing protein [Rhodoferax sp.]